MLATRLCHAKAGLFRSTRQRAQSAKGTALVPTLASLADSSKPYNSAAAALFRGPSVSCGVRHTFKRPHRAAVATLKRVIVPERCLVCRHLHPADVALTPLGTSCIPCRCIRPSPRTWCGSKSRALGLRLLRFLYHFTRRDAFCRSEDERTGRRNLHDLICDIPTAVIE